MSRLGTDRLCNRRSLDNLESQPDRHHFPLRLGHHQLEPGYRTPAFVLQACEALKPRVVTWYLKLDGAHGALPNWGIVRVEVPEEFFKGTGRDFGYLDRLSRFLREVRCRQASYAREPVSLEPIVRAEESLKALFAPPTALTQHFYRLTGL
jgi:hypothetical protein